MIHALSGSEFATVATVIVGAAACAIAIVTDLRERRVPNWLTFSALAVALFLAMTGGWAHFGITVLIVAGMLVLGLGLQASGILGGGDVKLLIAIAALVGFPNCIAMLLYTGVAGGLLALAVALAQGRLVQLCTGTVNSLAASWISRRIVVVQEGEEAQRPLPYALAIAAGFAVLVLSFTYLPAVRLPL